MPTKRLEIRFPRSGVVRAVGHDEGGSTAQGVFPTPWAVNTRPIDTLARRRRGGSRAGIAASGATLPTRQVQIASNVASVYNSASSVTAAVVAAVGVMPTTFSVGAMYRGRLCLASESVAYFSRAGKVTDWNYDADHEDRGRAIQQPLADAFGGSEQDITSIIPFRDSACLVGSAASLWALTGDPAAGQFRCVTNSVGPVGEDAWTLVEDTVVFLAKNGLWSVSPNGTGLKPLSPNRVPDELRDHTGANVCLAYSPDEEGVYIFTEGETYQWFYDLTDGGFWPMTMTAGVVPNRAAIVDGVLRLEHSGTPLTIGGTESITSHVLLGPFHLGRTGNIGLLQRIAGAMAEDSGTVTWKIIPGDTAEQAAEDAKTAVGGGSGYDHYSGTFTGGIVRSFHPRLRAAWIVIWLSSTAAWAYENVTIDVADAGFLR
jgi:hypothetical protein